VSVPSAAIVNFQCSIKEMSWLSLLEHRSNVGEQSNAFSGFDLTRIADSRFSTQSNFGDINLFLFW
jgi:hypothetical protein